MKIIVKVQTRARQQKIEKIDGGMYKVWVVAAPENNKANVEVVEVLAEHFGVAKSEVTIILGKTAREKLVEVPVNN